LRHNPLALRFTLFFARHIIRPEKASLSGPSVRIAVASIAVGIAVMIAAVSILRGFQSEIRDKISGFAAHIRVNPFSSEATQGNEAMIVQPGLVEKIAGISGVKHIEVTAYKTGILRVGDQFEGIILKGAGPDFYDGFMAGKLWKGALPDFRDTVLYYDIVISRDISDLLKIDTGMQVRMFFLNEGETQPRARRFRVAGIYDTGLEDFDKLYVLCDIRHIRRLNGWETDEAGLLEIRVDDIKKLEEVTRAVYQVIPVDLNVSNIQDNYPQIFDWLQLQDINVVVILILMIAVSAMAMTSALVILIIEKTRIIGTMKALGASNGLMRQVFLAAAAIIAFKGMLWGNLVGVLLMWLQSHFRLVRLPRESYYMEYVPVLLDLSNVLLINIITFVLCVFVLILPTYIIAHISPLKAIRFR
jgi:lipoprotein-releasing system permease protein